MMEYMNSLDDVYSDYERYVRSAEAEGKKPVSLLKYTFGNF